MPANIKLGGKQQSVDGSAAFQLRLTEDKPPQLALWAKALLTACKPCDGLSVSPLSAMQYPSCHPDCVHHHRHLSKMALTSPSLLMVLHLPLVACLQSVKATSWGKTCTWAGGCSRRHYSARSLNTTEPASVYTYSGVTCRLEARSGHGRSVG